MRREDKDFIHDLLAELLDLPGNQLVWSYANGVRPKLPHATIRIYGNTPAAPEEISPTDLPGVLSVRMSCECDVEIQYFSGADTDQDPSEILEIMLHRLYLPTVSSRWMGQNLAFFGYGPVNDITTILDDIAYERRAAIELHVRYTRTINDDPGYINEVHIHDTIKGDIALGKIEHDITIKGE